ncbi:MAG: LLM class F420-dependent oxidoreductase [Candidatus Rokubacteria bacterium]|nr:LLM class F420-dependent oxidoreductase [Candidatus Rokubacteria bacterium]
MEIGAHLPIFGPATTRHVVVGFARRLEALGFDSLWVSDHVVVPFTIRSRYPYSTTGDFPLPPTENFLEPLTTLAVVAGATERLKLGTTVLVLPHRHPVLLAKMLATLDQLAPGRVILGAGVGWMKEEIELFGVPHERRGAWSDEALRIIRACWAPGERVSFHGEFFQFDELGVFPKPAAGAIPIWIGGHTPAALRRVVQLGDGWHAAFPAREVMEPALARLREACRAAGRDFSTLTITARIGLASRRPADEVVAEIKGLADLGVSHVVLETRMRDLDDMVATYERFARDVRPRL